MVILSSLTFALGSGHHFATIVLFFLGKIFPFSLTFRPDKFPIFRAILTHNERSKDPTQTFKAGGTTPVHSLQFKNNGLLIGKYKSISWLPLDGAPVCSIHSTDKPISDTVECLKHTCVSLHESSNTIVSTFRGQESAPQTLVSKLEFKNRTVQVRG